MINKNSYKKILILSKISNLDPIILVHVNLKHLHGLSYNPYEFNLLVNSAGISAWSCWSIKITNPNKKYFLGTGLIEELKYYCQRHKQKKIIINTVLSPKHQSELEKYLCVEIMDRNQLILELFSQRAHSYEGKLQVELAKLAYLSTRLVRGWTHLERQRGGVGLRGGPGETQLEIDKRLLATRINRCKQKLEKFQKHRETTLKRRKNTFSVSLIGYTNAGKSTLFELLTKKKCYHDDRYFATLDPLSANLSIDAHKLVLTDTVGFIEHLPDPLLSAFKATLSEISLANLLCIVIDVSDSNYINQIDTIETILNDLKTTDIPRYYIFNKIDRLQSSDFKVPLFSDIDCCYISALKQIGITNFRQYLVDQLLKFKGSNNN